MIFNPHPYTGVRLALSLMPDFEHVVMKMRWQPDGKSQVTF